MRRYRSPNPSVGTPEASGAALKEALPPRLSEEGGSDNDMVQSSSDDDDINITR